MPELENFKRTPPYATELFGVYQPLLGWRSRQGLKRITDEQLTALRRLVSSLTSNLGVLATAPSQRVSTVNSTWSDSAIAAELRGIAVDLEEKQGAPLTSTQWKQIGRPTQLERIVGRLTRLEAIRTQVAATGVTSARLTLIPKGVLSSADAKLIGAKPVPGTQQLAITAMPEPNLNLAREAAVAQVAGWLAANSPAVLAASLLAVRRKRPAITPFIDPLAEFDPDSVEVMLSPVGLVNIYRQYFFDLESFLGPAVGHVWVSPGGTIEVVEVSTRRLTTERTMELLRESTERREQESTRMDEFADSVKEENQRDMKLGFSSSGGFSLGVVHASASASFNLDTSRRLSAETAHKRSRQQSERVASEVRSSFRTTFRTTVESTDTSSRRYTLTNATDKLVNYELRRKMRRVAVQVQHVGMQLCWQVHVKDPGAALHLPSLVHVAQRTDEQSSVAPPEAPAQLQPKVTELTVDIPFKPVFGKHDNRNELYINGVESDSRVPDKIKYVWEFEAPIPDIGYQLRYVGLTAVEKVDPGEDLPGPVAATYKAIAPNKFSIILESVNFQDQPAIRFLLSLHWDPPDQSATKAAFDSQLKEYKNKLQEEARNNAIGALRDRITVESNVAQRPAGELRQEERSVVYARLIAQLIRPQDAAAPEATTELIRSLFDIDRMLYFVAPDWWKPRPYDVSLAPSNPPDATEADAPEQGTVQLNLSGRKTYSITEDSRPAPLGSSLGWQLQLDGDSLRNAFLNAPWVKAVLPVRAGRELAALNWLLKAHVEGTAGLEDEAGNLVYYSGPEEEFQGKTLRAVLTSLATKLSALNRDMKKGLATDKVFETGFDPLAGGFSAEGKPYEIFDQWTEILPTDQVVAKEKEY